MDEGLVEDCLLGDAGDMNELVGKLYAEVPKGFLGGTKYALQHGLKEGGAVVAVCAVMGGVVAVERKGFITVWSHKDALCLTTAEVQGGDVTAGGVWGEHVVLVQGSAINGYSLSNATPGEHVVQPDFFLPVPSAVTCLSTHDPSTAYAGCSNGHVYSLTQPVSTTLIAKLDGVLTCILPHQSDIFAATAEGTVHHLQPGNDQWTTAASMQGINGTVAAMHVYKGHTLVVVASGLSVWSINESHPLINKPHTKIFGVADIHPGSSCTGLAFNHDESLGFTCAGNGSVKVWNFEKYDAKPYVLRVLPPVGPSACAITCTPSGQVVVGGEGGVLKEWRADLFNSFKDEGPGKSIIGEFLPEAEYLPPSKEYCKAEGSLLLMTILQGIVSLNQFLSLPFADDGMWGTEAEPMTHVLPVLNLKIELSVVALDVFYWCIVGLVVVFIALFAGGAVDTLLLKVSFARGMVNGNWPGLLSNDAAVVLETQKGIVGLERALKKHERMLTVVWRFMWLMAGMLLMPVVSKFAEVYACIEAVDGNATGEYMWAVAPEVECYTTDHKVKMCVSGVLGVVFVLLCLRLSIVQGDARLLCRPRVGDDGSVRTSLARRIFGRPWRVGTWSRLPPCLHAGSTEHVVSLIASLAKVAGGVVSSVTLHGGESAAKMNSIAIESFFVAMLVAGLLFAPYASRRTERLYFTATFLTAFAGACRIAAVWSTISSMHNDPPTPPSTWPVYLWYIGAIPSLAVSYLIFPYIVCH